MLLFQSSFWNGRTAEDMLILPYRFRRADFADLRLRMDLASEVYVDFHFNYLRSNKYSFIPADFSMMVGGVACRPRSALALHSHRCWREAPRGSTKCAADGASQSRETTQGLAICSRSPQGRDAPRGRTMCRRRRVAVARGRRVACRSRSAPPTPAASAGEGKRRSAAR
jgi:hypothetical protein